MSKTDKERAEVLFDALSDIDDSLLLEADENLEIARQVSVGLKRRRQWVAIAACFVILVAIAVPVVLSGLPKTKSVNDTANVEEFAVEEKAKYAEGQNAPYESFVDGASSNKSKASENPGLLVDDDGIYDSNGEDAFINGIDSLPEDETERNKLLGTLILTKWEDNLYAVVAIPNKENGDQYEVLVFEKAEDGYKQVSGFGNYKAKSLVEFTTKVASQYN